jgi:hypothetical protein
MSDTPSFLAKRLLAEGEKSAQFFQDLPEEAFSKTIYTDGDQWNVLQILIHFITAESSLCKLVENIAAGSEGTPENFNLDSYNKHKVETYPLASRDELIATFRNLREKTAQSVAQLSDLDLARVGRHPFLGVTTLVEIIKIIYRHNQIHQREIRQALG